MRIDKTFLPLMCSLALVSRAADLGVFESSQDIGKPSKTGSVEFDRAAGTYVIAGGGENMWFTNDAFHFAWTRVSGDFGLRAAVEWLGTGGNAHRKACLLVRQTLDADSAYVDVALHGDGLTSLQYRSTRGGPTREVQANEKGLRWAGLQREGNTFYMLLGTNADSLYPSGSFIRVQFTDPVYLGLGVCAHDDRALEKAQFSAVEVKRGPVGSGERKALHCALETVSISSKDRKVVFHTRDLIEAPNWTVDGKSLIYNSKGRLYRIPVSGGAPLLVDTGFATRCNNDHGLSPDGTLLVISDQSQGAGKSLIYTLPSAGGVPKLITPTGPSYWHGWSPDASTLAYCAERNGEYDVYTIPASGGQETRLTTAKGLDDGPEYSPDGKLIYFNSDRTGQMQIWRMRPDGTLQEQVTSDEFNNWFPHPSPDGKWLAFLSYEKDVTGHPANKPVKLRLMPLAGGPVQELASLFGGQGTINVPSWSPDSRQLAFVSYELLSQ
jgi:hypothetical protein